MQGKERYQQVLGLNSPWAVSDVELGHDKPWSSAGDEMLALRSNLISEDDRLTKFLK